MPFFLVVILFFLTVRLIKQLWHRPEDLNDASDYSIRVETEAAEDEPVSPGVFAINYDQRRGSQRSALMIGAAPELLPEVFFDLVERLGEKIVLVLDEKPLHDRPAQMLSFSQPIEARQLQTNLAEFADVINCFRAVELTAQNAEKCCYLTLKMDKSIVVETCNATPFIAALERRGLRRVQLDHWQHQGAAAQQEIPEERLAQLKQKLEISSCYVPSRTWAN